MIVFSKLIMRSYSRLFLYSILLALFSNFASAQIKDNFKPFFTHDLHEEKRIQIVTGSDPYLIFKTITWDGKLEIRIVPTSPLASDFTIDLFWSIGSKDFSESQKVRYVIPATGTPMNAFIDLNDLCKRFGFQVNQLRMLRVDPNLPVNTRFEWGFNPSLSDTKKGQHALQYQFVNDPQAVETDISIQYLNDIGVFDGQFKVMQGDPYIIFDFAQDPLTSNDLLQLEIEIDDAKQNYSYIELFWITATHGISEKYKVFFTYPQGKESSFVMLDLFDRLRSIEPATTEVLSLRIDFQYPFESPFKLNLKKKLRSETEEKTISLRYSIDARNLNHSKISAYAFSSALKEGLTRITHNSMFFFLYAIMLMFMASIIGISWYYKFK